MLFLLLPLMFFADHWALNNKQTFLTNCQNSTKRKKNWSEVSPRKTPLIQFTKAWKISALYLLFFTNSVKTEKQRTMANFPISVVSARWNAQLIYFFYVGCPITPFAYGNTNWIIIHVQRLPNATIVIKKGTLRSNFCPKLYFYNKLEQWRTRVVVTSHAHLKNVICIYQSHSIPLWNLSLFPLHSVEMQQFSYHSDFT